jgi:serine/threonine protein kinase
MSHYRLERLLGHGGYGVIYFVTDLNTHHSRALKIEIKGRSNFGLELEIPVLNLLQGSPYFPRIFDHGETEDFRWIVMELLGPSLDLLRFEFSNFRFCKFTGFYAAAEMLKCIEHLHSKGIVHRDIKPENFLLRADPDHPVCLIDYGLAKRYISAETGEILPMMENAGFVGTVNYTSVNVDERKDQGRRDDLISWFYSVVLLSTGDLPWKPSEDKHEVMADKKRATSAQLCAKLPAEMRQIWDSIQRLSFQDKPDYPGIYRLLEKAREKAKQHRRLDWQKVKPKHLEKISAVDITRPVDFGQPLVIFPSREAIDVPNLRICGVM